MLSLTLSLLACLPQKAHIEFDDSGLIDSTDADTDADSDTDTDSDTDADSDADSDSDSDTDSGETGDPGPIDADGDGYAADVDCDDADASVHPGATETCATDYDDDCDGASDDADDVTTWYFDADGDGYGDASVSAAACTAPADYVEFGTDCDDSDPAYHPGAEESDCTDPNDYNCDGSSGLVDSDGDGFAACEDCDDSRSDVNPAGSEVCDSPLADEDCDGSVNEAGALGESTWYADGDGDGYGDLATTQSACTAPSGYVADSNDCDDGDSAINPAATETCATSVDDDCDGATDDGSDTSTWYADSDSDGYGDLGSMLSACTAPSGYVNNSSDCDDSDPSVSPAGTELCATVGIDDDCDGVSDEDDALDATLWYVDSDVDGYGDPTLGTIACLAPSGYTADGTDCDDERSEINFGVSENYATIWDDDCDSYAHEDGTAYAGTVEDVSSRGASPVAESITFTGANWIGDHVGDLSADALFESATTLGTAGADGTTVWEIFEDSTGAYSTSNFVVDDSTWSSSLSGVYPGLEMLRGTSVLSVCVGIEFTGLTAGDQYAFAATLNNTDSSAVTVEYFTGTYYTVYGGVNAMAEESLVAGTDTQLIGGFEADSTVEQIYVCAGRATAHRLYLSHAWFSEASW